MAPRVACKFHPDENLIEDYRPGNQVILMSDLRQVGQSLNTLHWQICCECGLVMWDRVIAISSK